MTVADFLRDLTGRVLAGKRVLVGKVWGGAVRFAATLSTPGLLLATLFFAASLTPSLLPRTVVMQGVLSGVCLAAGYGLGVPGAVVVGGTWRSPLPGSNTQTVLTLAAAGLSVAIRSLDTSFRPLDALIQPDLRPPADPSRTGSSPSVVSWEELGRRGRESVAGGPKPRISRASPGMRIREGCLDVWIGVVDPPGWAPEDVKRLKRLLGARLGVPPER